VQALTQSHTHSNARIQGENITMGKELSNRKNNKSEVDTKQSSPVKTRKSNNTMWFQEPRLLEGIHDRPDNDTK
jgi:hypothetical protein